MSARSQTSGSPIEAAGGLLWRRGPRGAELAIVHRRRYGDWTLPKGKREPGETLEETAAREVREETGSRVRLGAQAGVVRYAIGDRPKEVHFWHMELVEAGTPSDAGAAGEVAEVAWLAIEEARRRLTYPGEAALLERVLPPPGYAGP